MCLPSELNGYTDSLRQCISVLFMFERKPVQNKEFSKDCRHWLDLLVSLCCGLQAFDVTYTAFDVAHQAFDMIY